MDVRPRHRDGTPRRRPAALVLATEEEDLPPEERARRERSREQAGGIVGYATDRRWRTAAFTLSGRLYVTALLDGTRGRSNTRRGHRPRPDPHGRLVAYVSGRALHVHDLATGSTETLAAPEGPQVGYGLADFVAAEEMDRMRGYWWSPDGRQLVVHGSTRPPCTAGTSPTRRTPTASPPWSRTRRRARRT